jgi:hypothetical protein
MSPADQQAVPPPIAASGAISWEYAALLLEYYAADTAWAASLHIDSPQRSLLLQQLSSIAELQGPPHSGSQQQQQQHLAETVFRDAAAVLVAALQQPLWQEQAYVTAIGGIAVACATAFDFMSDVVAGGQGDAARLVVPPQVAQSGLLPLLEAAVRQLAAHLTASAGVDIDHCVLRQAEAAAGSSSCCCTTSLPADVSSSGDKAVIA